MTIRHFFVFKTICECGSFTGAADKLNITQPAVSIIVRELEDYYDTKLFERANRKIYLTESGRLLLSGVTSILSQYDSLPDIIQGEGKPIIIKIGVNVAVGETIYPKIRKMLFDNNQSLFLEEVIANTESVIAKLRSNELDFAIIDQPHDSEDFTAYPLCSDDMRAVCAYDYVFGTDIDVHDLSRYTILLREPGSESRACIENSLSSAGVAIGQSIESVSTLSLINLARTKAGIVFLPESIALDTSSSPGMKIINVHNVIFKRDYYLIHRNNKFFSKNQLKLLHEILEYTKVSDGTSIS